MRLSLRKTYHGLFGIVVLLAVTACVSISSESEPVLLYRLSALQQTAAEPAAAPLALALNISSSRLLDSQRLWVMQANSQVQPLADFRWAMPAPELLRQTLIESLESAGVAVAVPSTATTGSLTLALRAMQIEIDAAQQAQARISLLATWSAGDDDHSSRLFEVRHDVEIHSADSAATAMDAASQALLSELSVWLQDQSRR